MYNALLVSGTNHTDVFIGLCQDLGALYFTEMPHAQPMLPPHSALDDPL